MNSLSSVSDTRPLKGYRRNRGLLIRVLFDDTSHVMTFSTRGYIDIRSGYQRLRSNGRRIHPPPSPQGERHHASIPWIWWVDLPTRVGESDLNIAY